MSEPSTEKNATPWHEYTEDVRDGSMCICGVPALGHDQIYPPRDPYSTRVIPPAERHEPVGEPGAGEGS